MTYDLGTAVVSFGADTGGFMSGFAAVSEKLKGLPLIGTAAAAAAVGVAAIGTASVKMAGDFESGVTSLVTGAGESVKNIDMIKSGMLSMATATATSTKQLTSGLFMIESAGYHGADGLKVLQNAAEGAKVGNADLGVVADATTTLMTDFGISANNSAQAVNALITTVSHGKTRMQDLAASLSSIAPTASAAHVSLADMMGAMATMTSEGVPAANAATYLRQAIVQLDAPGKQAVARLNEIGLSSQQVAADMQKSLPNTMKEITDALGKKFPEGSAAYMAALKDIAGGSKTMQAWLDLTGEHMQAFQDNVNGVSDAVKSGGNSIIGWTTVQQDFNFKLDQAKQSMETLMIRIGTALLPVVSKLFDVVTPLIAKFSDWVGNINKLNPLLTTFGQAWEAVTKPIKVVKDAGQPLFDTFDRMNGTFQATINTGKPLFDTFDRASAILHETAKAGKPFLDTFDRAEVGMHGMTDGFAGIYRAANPFIDLAQQLKGDWSEIKDIFSDLGGIFESVVGTVEDFASGIADTVIKTGIFQAVLTTVHDLMPKVGKFVNDVGGYLRTNLLPPIEHLIDALATTVKKFLDWMDKGGHAQGILNILSGTVQDLTKFLGHLIDGIATVVDWFNQGGPAVDLVKGALIGLGIIIAGFKGAQMLVEFNNKIGTVIEAAGKMKDKFGEFINWFSDTFLSRFKKTTGDASTGVEGIGKSAQKAEGEVATAATEEEASLGAVKKQADVTGGSVENIGKDAQIAESEVAAASTEEEVSLGKVGVAANGAGKSITAIGPESEAAAAAGTGAFAGFAAALPAMAIGAIIAIESYMLQDAIPALISAYSGGSPNPTNNPDIQKRLDRQRGYGGRGFASGGIIAPGEVGMVGDTGGEPELLYGGTSGISVYNPSQTAAMLGGGGRGDVHIYLDSTEFAHIIGSAQDQYVRARLGPRGRVA